MPYLNVMTRIEGRKHDDLLSDKGGRGFPYLVWMDAEGEVIATQGDRTVGGFESTLGLLDQRAALKAKADGGDATAKIDLMILDTQLGQMDFDELDGELETVTLNDAQKKTFQQLKANAVVKDTLAMLRRARGDKAAMAEAGKEFYGLYKTGVHPTGPLETFYWDMLRQHAEANKDVQLMGDAVGRLKVLLKDNQRAGPYIEKWEKTLAEMKGAATEGCGDGCGCDDGCGCGDGCGCDDGCGCGDGCGG